jgi:diguanylate cyclase (GGDEF)-like protein
VTESDRQLGGLKSSAIMMVDDDPTTILVLETFLQGEGYENFLAATDSRRALDLLAERNPDVLLLDLNMPNVGGFEILESMRADETLRYIPVIILTSSTDAQTKLKALGLGATDFLSKPVDPSELALRLRNTLVAKAYQDRLAYFDGLTGLPNKRLFTERVDRALRRARYESAQCAVLHIELERFEQISDTLGNRVGDGLLKAIAVRLENCVRSGDLVGTPDMPEPRTLSRVGGHEFTLFLSSVGSAEQAERVAQRVVSSLAEPFCVEGDDLFVTCRIGIALSPDDGERIETLLRHARMSHTKQDGRKSYQFYSESLNAESLERLSIGNQVRMALDRKEMLLHYQPKVAVRTGRIVGAEALMRWQHPELGLVPPGKFIPIAEETGTIESLGKWALRTACRQNKAWQTAGFGPIRMAVNVSGKQFLHGDFVETVRGALESSGLEARDVVLELTEGTIMENPREASALLEQLKEMDLDISVDDFGTGYSALSQLKRFPLDELKIDRSFIQGIPRDADDSAIVTAIIVMAHSLGLSVVAEGVETEEQLAFLEDQGCDEYQGFLFSRPVPPAEWSALLRTI